MFWWPLGTFWHLSGIFWCTTGTFCLAALTNVFIFKKGRSQSFRLAKPQIWPKFRQPTPKNKATSFTKTVQRRGPPCAPRPHMHPLKKGTSSLCLEVNKSNKLCYGYFSLTIHSKSRGVLTLSLTTSMRSDSILPLSDLLRLKTFSWCPPSGVKNVSISRENLQIVQSACWSHLHIKNQNFYKDVTFKAKKVLSTAFSCEIMLWH